MHKRLLTSSIAVLDISIDLIRDGVATNKELIGSDIRYVEN